MTLAQLLGQYVRLGIFALAAALSLVSLPAGRRESDGRMRIVTPGDAMFRSLRTRRVFRVPVLPYSPSSSLELLDHGRANLMLGGLLLFSWL